MEKIDEILVRLRDFAEDNAEDTMINIKKIDVIRLIDYIDKLEDKELLLNVLISKNVEININNKGERI